jgi:hypothetical protein
VIFIGPLPEGEYHFFGEFNPNSTKGTILVVPTPVILEMAKPMIENKVGGA